MPNRQTGKEISRAINSEIRKEKALGIVVLITSPIWLPVIAIHDFWVYGIDVR